MNINLKVNKYSQLYWGSEMNLFKRMIIVKLLHLQ